MSKKLKRIKSLTIKRSKWAHAAGSGSALGIGPLLQADGSMCCLGFACLAAGIEPVDIAHVDYPGDLGVPIPLLSRCVEGAVYNTRLAEAAVEINDNSDIDNATREVALRKLFASKGVRLRFVP